MWNICICGCRGEGFAIEGANVSGEAEDTGEDSAPILIHSSLPPLSV